MTLSSLNIQNLYSAVEAVDPGDAMEGTSYAKSSGNALASSWWIFIPYGTTINSIPTQSPLEAALQAALSQAGSTMCCIDVLDLNNNSENGFFTDAPSGYVSVASSFATLLNGLPDSVTPVIRYLTGRGPSAANSDGFATALCSAGITNARAKLYYCNFTPDMINIGSPRPASTARVEAMRGVSINLWQIILDAIKDVDADLYDILKDIEASTILGWVERFIDACADTSGSWNHSKMLAINGEILVTGGFNFWSGSRYESGASWLFDTGCTINGPAAQDAQAYVNSLWAYANGVAQNSAIAPQATSLTGGKPSFSYATAPIFDLTATDPGSLDALTIAKTGMLTYDGVGSPALILDGIRDFLINIIAVLDVQQTDSTGAVTAFLVEDLLNDTNAAFQTLLGTVGVTPAVWASRYARSVTVASATQVVRLSQQKLIMDDLYNGSSDFQDLVAEINTELGLQGSAAWDGFIRPYDLFAAMGAALATMSAASGSPTGIEIIGSTSSSSGGGYEDPVVIATFLSDLATLMDGLKSGGYIAFEGTASQIAQTYLAYRRIDNPAKSPPNHANHSKVVVVDDALMYVGSDNAYPSYNDEFGVWIDDTTSISDYVEQVWNQTWSAAYPRT